MPSRQAIHARAQRAARGLKPPHRPRWQCPTCGGAARSMRTGGERRCDVCDPPKRRGRPRKEPAEDVSPPM